MQLCFYLLLVLHVAEGCRLENHGTTKEITAYTGESVLLPCYCTDTSSTPETFTWRKEYINRHAWEEVSNKSGPYKGRLQLFNFHSSGNVSLLISHLTEEDGGVYLCEAGQSYTGISLIVKGCTLENHGRKRKITAYTGETVLLTCSCTDANDKPPGLTWKKINTTGKQWEKVSNESGQYKNKVTITHSPGRVAVNLTNLNKEDGGVFRCKAEGRGFAKITLTVEGIPPPTPSSTLDQIIPTSAAETSSTVSSQKDSPPSNTVIYICAAVGASLLLMILGGVFYWRYRAQRRGRTESQTGSRGGQETQDDALVLYETVKDQDTHQEEQEQDDVTYSTVVHNKPSTSAHTLLDTGDTTEYACIKRS